MRLDELSLKYVLNDTLRKVARLDAWVRLVPVFILDTHNPDELQNICPSSSRQIMRPSYKNGQYGFAVSLIIELSRNGLQLDLWCGLPEISWTV